MSFCLIDGVLSYMLQLLNEFLSDGVLSYMLQLLNEFLSDGVLSYNDYFSAVGLDIFCEYSISCFNTQYWVCSLIVWCFDVSAQSPVLS